MKKTVSERYIPGNYYMECDRCGLSYRRSDLRRDGWKEGLMVCDQCWDFRPTYPSPPPDQISVPVARPKQEVTANDGYYNYTFLGANLFPDPWIDPDNDGLWSGGVDSQQHVRAAYYAKRLTSETITISVPGLTAGLTYILKISTWSPDTASVLINGDDSGLFTSISALEWQDDSVIFTAPTDTIVLSFVAANTQYYDNIYVQRWYTKEVLLPPSEVIFNPIPQPITDNEGIVGLAIDFFSFDEHTDFNSNGFADLVGEGGGILVSATEP